MKKNSCFIVIWIAIGLAICPSILAAPLVSQGDLNPLDIVIDFESLTHESSITPPLALGGATFSSGSNFHIYNIVGYAAPIIYPTFVSGNVLTSPSHSAVSVPITITFAQPISEIGLGIFDPNYAGNVLKVYSSSGQLLETVASLTADPGGDFADFIGVIRPYNDISYAEVVPAPRDYIAIDNVTFGSYGTPVPEPSTMLLLVSGLIGVWGFRRIK